MPSRILLRQFALFLAVGVLNTGFSYLVFVAGIWVGIPFALATLVAMLLGTLFNFRTTGSIVFRNADRHRLAMFVVVYAIAYLVNVSVQKLCHWLGLSLYLSGFVALPPTVIITFVLLRGYVFRSAQQGAPPGGTARRPGLCERDSGG